MSQGNLWDGSPSTMWVLGIEFRLSAQWQVFILFCWIVLLNHYINFLLHLYVCIGTCVSLLEVRKQLMKISSYCVGTEDGTKAANAFIYWDNLVAPLWHSHILLSHISKTTETCLLVRFSALCIEFITSHFCLYKALLLMWEDFLISGDIWLNIYDWTRKSTSNQLYPY